MRPKHIIVNMESSSSLLEILFLLLDKVSGQSETELTRSTFCVHDIGFGTLDQVTLNSLLLLSCGPDDDVHIKRIQGSNLNLLTIQALLDNGAQVSSLDSEGSGPLHRAVLRQRLKETELLLMRGANVNEIFTFSRDVAGETCLNTAYQLGDLPMIRLLLKFGADVWPHEVSLLWHAASERDLEMLHLLAAVGVDFGVLHPVTERNVLDTVFE